MDKIRLQGGRRLEGRVWVSGSKNASLPILAASLLVDGPVWLENVPDLKDIDGMLHMLNLLGVRSEREADGALRVETVDESGIEAPYHLVRTMRASFCLLGPLWAKRGRAIVSYPGGCVFGHRPVDLHLKGLQALGARTKLTGGNVHIDGTVEGGQVYLGSNFGSTVLGTANVLMAAVLAKGESVIEYAAQEPEIVDLCHFLQECGARIDGVGSHRLHIQGVERLTGCRYRVIPDRIEAGTLVVAGLMTRGEVEVCGARPDHMAAFFDRLRAAEAPIEVAQREFKDDFFGPEFFDDRRDTSRPPVVERPRARRPRIVEQDRPFLADRIFFDAGKDDVRRWDRGSSDRDGPTAGSYAYIRTGPWDRLQCLDLATMPYPGFPTDLQAQLIGLMCLARGVSIITEKIYPERFIHVAELARLGARIRREGPSAIVMGGEPLTGATVMASDLRASAALVLAGLVAEGTTEVRRVYHLDRGYERFVEKLRSLGADIERVSEG